MTRKLLVMLLCACLLAGAVSCSKHNSLTAPSPDASTDESNYYNDITAPTPQIQAPFPAPTPPTQTSPPDPEESLITSGITMTQAANLQKLCKVWGFVKYTHLAFLSGEKDWDEELLGMIPIIQFAAEDEVNDILYDWFISLGDDGYDGHSSSYYRVQSKEYSNISNRDQQQWNNFSNKLNELAKNYWLSLISSQREGNHGVLVYRVDNNFLQSFLSLVGTQNWMFSVTPASYEELNIRAMADMAWITDESYLGAPLSSALARFREIPVMDMTKAPVHFSETRTCDFSNEMEYAATGVENRLLGLFRLWNAIEYYHPYKDIMDHNWNELLLEQITEMIKGTDTESYILTLYALSAKINDGHIYYSDEASVLSRRFSGNRLFAIPAIFEYAEGQIVIWKTLRESFLQRGDVVLSIDGADIVEIIEEVKRFIAVPNDEKLKRVMPYLPLCKSITAEITLLRNGEELTGTVKATRWSYSSFATAPYNSLIKNSHELLTDNIGLINPSQLSAGEVSTVMAGFSNTSGLIIDLRQYPGSNTRDLLAKYLLDAERPYAVFSIPFIPVPGLFFDATTAYAGPGRTRSGEVINPYYNYFYNKPVVILMNQQSQSACETMIMCLRLGQNVTVIGSNSIGVNGDITYLSLPGASRMSYSCFGVYTPEGGQTQRIGLIPDIYVEPTIEGIRDGRDELMEAAVAFLLEKQR